MSLSKRTLDDLSRPDPLEDVYYGEEWPSDEQLAREAAEENDERPD